MGISDVHLGKALIIWVYIVQLLSLFTVPYQKEWKSFISMVILQTTVPRICVMEPSLKTSWMYIIKENLGVNST